MRSEIPNNYPPIPLLSLALQRIHETDPTAVPKARTIAKNMNTQLIDSYSLHHIEGLVKIPYSHISTDGLPDGMFAQKAHGQEHKFVFFPGVGGNLTDQISTAFDIMTERIAQSQTQPIPPADFYFIGHPTGPGGEISQNWLDGLRSNGLSQYNEAHADLLRHVLPQDTEGKNIFYYGTSMGTYAAIQASEMLTEWQGKNANILKNPPGSYERERSSLGEKLQLVVGYGIENALRRIRQFAKNTKDLSQRDQEFLTSIAPILKDRGISLEEDEEQRKLKRQGRLEELLILAKKPVLPKTTTPTTIEQGVWDLISFSPKDAIRFMQGKRVTVYEYITHKLTPDNHSPEPYPDQMMHRMISAIETI